MKNLGLKNNTKDIANLEDIKTPSNMVTTDSAQTISGAKTFTKTMTFQNDIKANGSAGKLGQVLMSQGSGNSPKWGDVPAPSNVVTTNTEQTITAKKNFNGGIGVEGSNSYFTNVSTATSHGIIIDCYENVGSGDSIFRVDAAGEDVGTVYFGDGMAEVNIVLGSYTYFSSDVVVGTYPRTTITRANGVEALSSQNVGTRYYAGGIQKLASGTTYTISIPNKSGTLALTSDIPIKSATLNGTTLSITLS